MATADLGAGAFGSATQAIFGGQPLTSAMEAVTGTNASASHLSSTFLQSAIDGAAGSLRATVKLNFSRFAGARHVRVISSKPSLLTGLEDIALGQARGLVGVSAAMHPVSATMRLLGLGWTPVLLNPTRELIRFDSILSGIAGSLNIADAWARAIPFPFFPEGTDPGDLERLRSRRLDDAGRYAAALRLAGRVRWKTSLRPGVKQALAARAEAKGRSKQVVKQEELAGRDLPRDRQCRDTEADPLRGEMVDER